MEPESHSGVTPLAAEPGVRTPYERLTEMIAAGRCVILDGGVGTELPKPARAAEGVGESLWGTRALVKAPDAVLDVHRRYVAAGCDVISTNTWGLASVLAGSGPRLWEERDAPVHWMDVARRAVRLARRAIDEQGRTGECAVAFSLNAEIDSEEGRETLRLLARVFADPAQRPDLILVETLSLLHPSLDATVERLLAVGLPVWLSFRRCRRGMCGVHGEHWGGPEGDAFGRAARRFEQLGVGALLVNCIPPDHVDGIVSYLRDFTDLPLGAYPNLGYYTDRGWRFETGVGGEEYTQMALRWREEGAQLVGGCCGVRPDHIAAARAGLAGTQPGDQHRAPLPGDGDPGRLSDVRAWTPWADRRGRRLYPLPYPELSVEPGVAAPDQASLMVWRHLLHDGIGAHQRCLDVGCGSGLQTVQLARNGAAHVHAIDIDPDAVANTLGNAFRNGVDDRVSGQVVDLFPWVPEERYEVVVACLQQEPMDPFQHTATHRRVDYWGRNLLDQLLGKLGDALTAEGVAYVMQLSILSEQRTAELLAAAGLAAQVVDYALFPFEAGHANAREQIARVESLSDAYHVTSGDRALMAGYLLEVRRRDAGAHGDLLDAPLRRGGE